MLGVTSVGNLFVRPRVFRLDSELPEAVVSLREVLQNRGWEEFDAKKDTIGADGEVYLWDLYWKASRITSSVYKNLLPNQRVNHIPATSRITKKDDMIRNLRRMKAIHGKVFNFSPDSFILPRDSAAFAREFARQKEEKGEDSVWICKPAVSSQGKNITIIRSLSEVKYDCSWVVQKYISNPLLIGGYKFDLRIYVLVNSLRPFESFIYRKGLIRFSTQKYDADKIDNLFMHLTNSSINKTSPTYDTEKGIVGFGCKWSFKKFFDFLRSQNINTTLLWEEIRNICLLTLFSIVDVSPPHAGCFEVLGFDVLIDEKLKPWLLEVNAAPAISVHCQADALVKYPLLNDTLDVIGFEQNKKVVEVLPTRLSRRFTRRRSQQRVDTSKREHVRASRTRRAHSMTRAQPPRRHARSSLGFRARRELIRRESSGNVRKLDPKNDFEPLFPWNRQTAELASTLDPLNMVNSTDPTAFQMFKRLAVKSVRERARKIRRKYKRASQSRTTTKAKGKTKKK